MKTCSVSSVACLAILNCCLIEHGHAAVMLRFDASPGSKIVVKGQSNIHEWRAEGSVVSGFLEIESGFDSSLIESPQGKRIEARAAVFIPVRNLKAVGKTWNPDNEQITEVMHRMLKVEEHPRINFLLRELTVASERAPDDSTYECESKGDLVIAGVTNRISMPLKLFILPEAKLKISGTACIKQSDFNIIPKPRPVLDSWDNDTVEIVFDWILKQKGGA